MDFDQKMNTLEEERKYINGNHTNSSGKATYNNQLISLNKTPPLDEIHKSSSENSSINETEALKRENNINKGYSFLAVLGSGGNGTVFLALKLSDKQKVAIKKIPLINPKARREIKISHLLSSSMHLYLLNYIEPHWELDNALYFVIEYCSLGSLLTYQFYHPLEFSEEFCFNIIRNIVCAYTILNEKGIVHRDIKLENIMMAECYSMVIAKLGDFGYSRLLEEFEDSHNLTHVGTENYISPEMLNHEKYDYKSDIFSIGIVYFRILFNRFPYVSNMRYIDDEATRENIYNYYKQGAIEVDTTQRFISQASLDFLVACLQFNATSRIDIKGLNELALITRSYDFDIKPVRVVEAHYQIKINKLYFYWLN